MRGFLKPFVLFVTWWFSYHHFVASLCNSAHRQMPTPTFNGARWVTSAHVTSVAAARQSSSSPLTRFSTLSYLSSCFFMTSRQKNFRLRRHPRRVHARTFRDEYHLYSSHHTMSLSLIWGCRRRRTCYHGSATACRRSVGLYGGAGASCCHLCRGAYWSRFRCLSSCMRLCYRQNRPI